MNPPDPTPTGGGISGSLKIIIALAVLIFATLGVLMVLKVIDLAFFQDLAQKTGMILGIVAAAIILLGLLSKSKGR